MEMISDIIKFILKLIGSMIQVLVWPINQLITNTLPDFANKLIEVGETITSVFNNMSWGLGLLPSSVILTLIFIVTVEITRHTIFISSHAIHNIFRLIKNIKFW